MCEIYKITRLSYAFKYFHAEKLSESSNLGLLQWILRASSFRDHLNLSEV